MTFAVIDFETTGLLPERHDRVVEVAVVLVDGSGSIESDWVTLVNPRRDIGAPRIHGLRAADLAHAPEFDAVADQILQLVAGRAVVAHNASFDMRFLHSELHRAGYSVPDQPQALCSMKWSGALVGPAKLQHVCEALGIPLHNAHSALGDARATAMLLAHLMRGASRAHSKNWDDEVERSRRFAWPARCGRPRVAPVLRGERGQTSTTWLEKVLEAAWVPGVPEDHASYILVLERALLDRVISRSEAEELQQAARGLSTTTIRQLHLRYLCAVVREALSDGILTDEERIDIQSVAHTLGLTSEDVEGALSGASAGGPNRGQTFSLASGDRVVFTGEMSRDRDDWIALIMTAGLVSGGVTKSTKVVVAEDPDSLSGKAAKARQYNIPIVTESAFERLFQSYCAARAD